MTDEIKIEKGVPLSARTRRGPARAFPLREMAVGDSFAAPADRRRAIFSAIQFERKTNKGRKFCTRTGGGVVRVWRIE